MKQQRTQYGKFLYVFFSVDGGMKGTTTRNRLDRKNRTTIILGARNGGSQGKERRIFEERSRRPSETRALTRERQYDDTRKW